MRARVNERLTQAARFPVTLIVAPAGFGKSVALRDFIASAQLDVLRLDLRREDTTLLEFVRRLSEAISPVAPSAGASFPALAQRVMATSQPVRELSDWFVEHLKHVSGTIVIDDLHYAAADLASVAFLADVVERTSGPISWIIAARTDVGLPMASWIAYGRMDFAVGEDDLRFTPEEALAAAGDSTAPIEPQEVEALRKFTDGWPVALSIALRTRTRAGDLPSATSGTRDLVYRYLAEQVFGSLSPLQRAFLLASSVFSTFDGAIVDKLGATPEFLAELRRDVTFLVQTPAGDYRYHDLFREFLESELLRRGHHEWHAAICRGAAIMESQGNDAAALRLYARARDAGSIGRIVDRAGIVLFERGEGETLRAALASLTDEELRGQAMLLGIRAMLEAARGHFEAAEPDFSGAIERSNVLPLRLNLVHRYAVELVRNGRDCIALLEPYAGDANLPAGLQLPILGTLATAYAGKGALDNAARTIERALKLMDSGTADEIRARVNQQAAYIYQFSDTARARKYAELAIEIAVAKNLYDVAARACSVVFAIAYNETPDSPGLLAILDRLIEFARKGGSEQTRLYGLIASYDLHVERGEEGALAQIEHELEQTHAALPLASTEMLMPARALRSTWSGDFATAFALLKDTPSEQRDDERRALAAAQVALYAFAAGLEDDGNAALLAAAEAAGDKAPGSVQLIRARLFLALAELLRGRSGAAHRHSAAAERACAAHMHQLRAFAHAVRVAERVQLGQAERNEWDSALERLGAIGFGGIARMLTALPIGRESSERYTSLTASERQILQLLAQGASSKDVAAKTGRSPQTVDTHIRSICRKLGCSGRREAIALATSRGWVETSAGTEP